MIVLAIETSSAVRSVALLSDDRLLAQEATTAPLPAGNDLTELLDRLFNRAGLTLAAVDLYAGGIGPGSFTGIRIGLATLKAIRLVHPRPGVGISSTEVLARSAMNSDAILASVDSSADRPSLVAQPHAGQRESVITLLHSHARLFYAAAFGPMEREWGRRMEDSLCAEDRLSEALASIGPSRIIGAGLARLSENSREALSKIHLIHEGDELAVPTAPWVGRVAIDRIQEGADVASHPLQPLYLQPSV